jgi:hypothetical protein
MTATIETTAKQDRADWRITMIDLAEYTYLGYCNGIQPDDDTLCVIGNSLADIKVRDCLVWKIVNEVQDPLKVADLLASIDKTLSRVSGSSSPAVAALFALAAILHGSPAALFAAGLALGEHIDSYSFAGILAATVSVAGPAGPKMALGTLTYDECLYGSSFASK